MNIFLYGILLSAIVCQVKCDITDNNIRPIFVGGRYISPIPPRPCNIAFRCSDEEDVQWATDGSTCSVLRNPCTLASVNCDRRNQNLKVLAAVDKSDCQKLCRDICPQNYSPVCALYNGRPRSFSNNCNLSSHICQSGETYEFFSNGECPQRQ